MKKLIIFLNVLFVFASNMSFAEDIVLTREEENAFFGDSKTGNILLPIKVDISGNLVAGYNSASEELDVTQMNVSLELEFGDRIKAVLDLDGRAIAGKKKIKERLINNPQLRASVASSIRLAIATRLGIDPSLVTVPQAALDQTVASLVDGIVSRDAIKESTIRQLFVSVELVRTENAATTITVGKVDPIYYNEELYGNFATANPEVRITQEYKSWTVTVSAYNNRYGENWNIDGTAVAQVQNLVERIGRNNELQYDINSYEVAISKITKTLGNVIVAMGTRDNGIETSDKSTYTVVQINPELGSYKISLTGSAEKFDRTSVEVPGGGTRTRFTAEVLRAINERTVAYLQAYYGNQGGTYPNKQKALVLGIERIFYTRSNLNVGARFSVFSVENSGQRIANKKENGIFSGFVVRWK